MAVVSVAVLRLAGLDVRVGLGWQGMREGMWVVSVRGSNPGLGWRHRAL